MTSCKRAVAFVVVFLTVCLGQVGEGAKAWMRLEQIDNVLRAAHASGSLTYQGYCGRTLPEAPPVQTLSDYSGPPSHEDLFVGKHLGWGSVLPSVERQPGLLLEAFDDAASVVNVESFGTAPEMYYVVIKRVCEASRSLAEYLAASGSEENLSRRFQEVPPGLSLGDVAAIEVNSGVLGDEYRIGSRRQGSQIVGVDIYLAETDAARCSVSLE